MKRIREIGVLLLLLAGGIAAGALLMLGTFAIPSSAVREHVRLSADLLAREGLTAYAVPGYTQSRLDNFTDALMLGGAVLAPYGSLPENAMLCERFSGYDPLSALRGWLQGASPETEPYSRYWHGYLFVLKPLLLVFSLGSVRYLLAAAMLLLTLLLAGKLARPGMGALLPFFVLLAALCPPALMNSLHYAPCVLIALASGLAVLRERRRLSAPVLFLIAGMATAFFDFLSFPVLTLVLPLSLYALRAEGTRSREVLLPLFMAACAWGLGFAGMWAGKWLAGSLLTGRDLLADALSTLRIRTAARDVDGDAVSVFAGFAACLRTLVNPVVAAAFLASFLSLLAGAFRRRGTRGKPCPAKRLALLLIALIPVCWTILACNHSLEHSFFAYRALASSVFPLLLAVSAPPGVDNASLF